ncbi:MAG: hypothetical protein IJS67_00545 [Clostridia bacterium]|nr:hypothetical protein [Clostridia bacterium]
MIHSLSGGVIKSGGSHTFVKVRFIGGDQLWYLSDDFALTEGMKVYAPHGGQPECGYVVRVESKVSEQASPVPIKKAEKVISVLFDDEEET